MLNLNTLKNTSKYRKARKRVGRGIGCGNGKTCGRGEKGSGSRSGYKARHGYEGGQFRLFMKLPIRGFSNVRFQKRFHAINLGQIEQAFDDGEVVNVESMKKHGFIEGESYGIKILGEGELKKRVSIEAHSVSQGARDKLQKAKIPFEIIQKKN